VPLVRLGVFCGSSDGRHPAYVEAARTVGRLAAARGLAIVYGGSRLGLMGAVADAALAAGGTVIGVIPRALVDREIAHSGLSALHVVSGMHERKAKMAELSHAFVALPGGAGTLDELFEIWTWAQLGLHDKPIGLLDLDGFYTHLLRHLDTAVAAGFLRPSARATLRVASDPHTLFQEIGL
jgi:uncharacterized protein (TIGR00730 family)